MGSTSLVTIVAVRGRCAPPVRAPYTITDTGARPVAVRRGVRKPRNRSESCCGVCQARRSH
jgi:hypothetical protein